MVPAGRDQTSAIRHPLFARSRGVPAAVSPRVAPACGATAGWLPVRERGTSPTVRRAGARGHRRPACGRAMHRPRRANARRRDVAARAFLDPLLGGARIARWEPASSTFLTSNYPTSSSPNSSSCTRQKPRRRRQGGTARERAPPADARSSWLFPSRRPARTAP